ncbi:hypothetical protein IscW_ISCW002115 [Ixodes scapularis]|uniref:Neurotransmitter-gated ion-channel ligand-binding domain-containing protein n=1 Tax=Ixodes scapularis TaxID=6945 RepID=B7PCS3_IXOSC|nr:hypothetical protein IscW_ISCW002115 [Ixodes scapularis]|eukprot:XP_002410183.1 hypothetical protein IscW_ISCW002115 [Ixodes scapularis]
MRARGSPDAKRLYDDLISRYNKLVRPVVNDTDPLTVKIKLKLSQLIEVGAQDDFTPDLHVLEVPTLSDSHGSPAVKTAPQVGEIQTGTIAGLPGCLKGGHTNAPLPSPNLSTSPISEDGEKEHAPVAASPSPPNRAPDSS